MWFPVLRGVLSDIKAKLRFSRIDWYTYGCIESTDRINRKTKPLFVPGAVPMR